MIHADELSNPEQGLELLDRDEAKPVRKRPEPPEIRALREEASSLRQELGAFRARLEAARTLKPKPHRVHNCSICANNARDATIRAIEGT